jgi:hypothetical protein
MTRWVRTGWRDDGYDITTSWQPGDDGVVIAHWEVGDHGWVTRSVELHGARRVPMVAASLAECLAARDTGRIEDVQEYEAAYGVLVEKPIADWDFPHEDITAEEFDDIWRAARAELDQRRGG